MSKKKEIVIVLSILVLILLVVLGVMRYEINDTNKKIEAEIQQIVYNISSRIHSESDIISFNIGALTKIREAAVCKDIKLFVSYCRVSSRVYEEINTDISPMLINLHSKTINMVKQSAYMLEDDCVVDGKPARYFLIEQIDNLIAAYRDSRKKNNVKNAYMVV